MKYFYYYYMVLLFYYNEIFAESAKHYIHTYFIVLRYKKTSPLAYYYDHEISCSYMFFPNLLNDPLGSQYFPQTL